MAQTIYKVYDKVSNYFTDPKFGKPPQKRNIVELLDLGIIRGNRDATTSKYFIIVRYVHSGNALLRLSSERLAR